MITTPILKGFASMDAYLYSTISDAEMEEWAREPCQCSRCGLNATYGQMGRVAPTSGRHLCLPCFKTDRRMLETDRRMLETDRRMLETDR